MKTVFFCCIFFTMYACSEKTEQQPTRVRVNTKNSEINNNKASWSVYHTPEIGWGYRIFKGSKLIIDQQHIPAVPGIKGFDTRSKAERTAQYIMKLIAAGNERPSLSTRELDSIGAINLEDYEIPEARTDIEHTIEKIQD